MFNEMKQWGCVPEMLSHMSGPLPDFSGAQAGHGCWGNSQMILQQDQDFFMYERVEILKSFKVIFRHNGMI